MRIIRNAAVAEKLGVSMPTYWRLAKRDPTFPPAVSITEGATGRVEEEVDTWIAQRVAESRKAIA